MKLKSPISRTWLKSYIHRTFSFVAMCAAASGIALADSSDLVITEIQSDSVNTSTGGDYWELTNNGTTPVDLSNWKWNDSARVTTGSAVSIPAGTTIAAGESIIFTGVTASNFRTWWGLSASVQVISATAPGLGSGDGVSLFNSAGTEVLYLGYAAGNFTRSDGSASTTGHAGASGGGAAKSPLILDPTFATIPTKRRYKGATVATFGVVASASPTGDIGSPGVSGLPKAVDLSMYVRVGRYDLPEPTRTTPPNGVSLLAQEASGVTYNWDTDTLFITADGGTSIVQVSKTGQLVDSMTLAPGSSPQGTDFYDPEGITYVGNGKFVMSEERDRQLVQFTYAAGTTLSRSGAKTVKLGTFVPNTGTEGLSYDPQTGGFICLKEIDPMGIFQTGVDFDAGTATNGSASTINSIDLFNPTLAGMLDFADVFALSNVPSMSGTPDSGRLLLLSQESAKIVNIDRSGTIFSTLTIQSDPGNPLTASAQQHEGLTMDRNGILYVVSENGGGDFDHPQLWVYAPSAVPNQAPTALALNNKVSSILENTSTATPVKVADIAITDDGLGTNNLTVTGTDASFFEITAGALYIKAGTVLDYETKTGYSITVHVDDTTVGATPDATALYALAVTDVVNETPALPSLIISEVAPWSSGDSPVGADWFEVTNTGSTAVDITGWKVDDSSAAFGSALALNGITSIAPGESVIFMETSDLAGTSATFKNTWFGANPPAGLQIGNYSGSGIGLGTSGDAVNLYNAAGVLQASVSFGSSPAGPSFPTFNNALGLNNSAISQLSVVGVNSAFTAVNHAAGIGSPGSVGKLIISEVAPWSSGNSPVGADWFEVTNTTAHAIDITGWKVDDSSESFAAALPLNGITSIAAGESVIFMETDNLAATGTTFRSTWFGANPPAGLQIGSYTGGGIGLSTGGDAVNLYNAAGVLKAKVFFAASPAGPSFPTFDNAIGLNEAAISQLSAVGFNGAFAAVNDAAEIGSPGTKGTGAPVGATISISSFTVSEEDAGTTTMNLAVTRSNTTTGFTVSYAVTGGTATAGTDYVTVAPGTLTFAVGGNATQNIAITINGDTEVEATETIQVTLSNVVSTTGITAISSAAGTGTITDDDAPLFTSTNRDILLPNTGKWSTAGVTVNGTKFINLGLQGVGRVPANSIDPATGESVGSISDMQVTGWTKNSDGTYSGTFHFLPDRGYNSGTIYSNYAARINQFSFNFTPYTSATPTVNQNQVAMTFTGSTRFKYDHDGNAATPAIFSTGLLANNTATFAGGPVPSVTESTTQSDGTFANRMTIDSEGLVLDKRASKAGSGWMSDEYGPYIYHFNSTKEIDGWLRLPAAILPHQPVGTVSFVDTNTNGRRTNQGMEGLAQSPDGSKLFGLLQSAMLQDSGAGNQGRFNTRLLVYDVSASDSPSDPVAQYVIQLPRMNSAGNGGAVDRTGAQSSILAINDHQLLILSRDGNGRGATGAPVFKSILLAELNGATNIDGTYDAEGTGPAPSGVLSPSVTPLTWTEALNMIGKLGNNAAAVEVAKFGLNLNVAPGDINSIGEKWEALELVSANDPANPNDYFLFIGNDNDFQSATGKYKDASGAIQSYDAGLENDTVVLAYRVRMTGSDNQAPFVANTLSSQPVVASQALSFTVPANTFADPNSGQTLTYTATKADGTSLPAWLTFNGATRTFSGTPAAGDAGTLMVKVTATDNGTPVLSVSTTFAITVTAPPAFSFASATYSVREDAIKVTLTINRTGDTAAASINVSTADGTAVAGTDYTALAASPVTFAAAATSKTFDITIKNRAGVRANRAFTVSLTSPGAPVTTASPSTATVTITEADSFATTNGPSSSTTPYLQPINGNWQTTSILSVGDAVPLTGTTTGETFQMAGIPDGLGAYDNGNGTMTLLMNHEFGNTLGAVRAHGAIGAYVSEWIINKSTLQVVSGSDLIRQVYDWNTATQTSNTTTSTVAFNRFCSADLPVVSAYYNAATGLGTQERIYMNGDESGANGYAMAHVATGPNKGKSYVLGKFNLTTNGSGLTGVGGWENVLASPYAQDKTVVIGTNDGGTGIMTNSVAVYVGTKTNVGTEADKAGLTNGVLKFVNVAGNATEIANTTTRTTGITSGMAFTLSATTSTVFSRPEDGVWDTVNPNRFYFVTTDRLDQVADGLGTQIGRTRLWRLNFTDIANPDLGGTVDLLVEGGVGNDANMWDNMTITSDGKIMMQEDVGGAPHNGKIWSYDPVTGSLAKVLRHDAARFGDVVGGVITAATSPFTNDEEGSGIIDVTSIFGGNATIGDRYFLTSVQAHYPQPGALIEGGQLVLAHQIASTTGISSSSSPYILPLDSSWQTKSVLTVGDAVPLTGTTTGETFQMAGIPDGLGAYDNGNGTLTLLMNHEFGNTLGALRAHGAIGAYVSEWIINKSTLQVVSGSDLIRQVYDWNTATQTSNTTTSTVAFNRFCSADLPVVSAYYNAATGLGTQERLYMNGDESGANGYAMAHVATGSNKGKSYVLGKFNLTTNGSGLTGVGGWENVLASPYAQDKTVVIGTNDGGTGIMTNSVAVYVGTKTNVGTEADKAGLTNGVLKFVNVAGNATEIANTTTRTTGITSGMAFTLNGTASTVFSRPEDGVWDTVNPNRFYFVTTDRLDQVADGLGSQIGRTRLWRLNFTDIANPDLGGTIDLLVEGGVGNDANMWDNMTITSDGKIMMQEDVGGAPHNGKIWSYDPVTGSLAKVLRHDPMRFGDVVGGVIAAATSPFTNDEEGSGIIDVTSIFGGNTAAGEHYFLTSIQAHYPQPGALIEGGQLALLRQSPKTAFSLASATATVNEDAGSITLTVNRFGDLQYPASVKISTAGDTAVAGTDFTAISNIAIDYASGESSKTVQVAITSRAGFQGDRDFNVVLSNPGEGSVLGGISGTAVTISEVITPSVIHLADATVTVNQGATVATINLTRSSGSSPVTVDVQTTNGTALAGTDYVAPTGAGATVSFPANVSTVSKEIVLTPNLTAAQNKSFTVTLANPSANASIGLTEPVATTVRILASDTAAPTVAIIQPTANQIINRPETDSITLSGTATDNVEVSQVQVSLNGGSYADATLTSSAQGVTWNLAITPVGGKNDFKVRALDARGNTSAVATRSFTYKKLSALAVNVVGNGKVTGQKTGVVYEVGKSYTLTATPAANQVFNGWSGAGLMAPSNEVAKFTFIFSDALFADPVITASFITKPFTPAEIGVFTGLVTPHSGTALSNSTQGFMTLTLTATGSFSGSLKIDSFTLSIKGSLTNAGDARFGTDRSSVLKVERPDKPGLEVAQVHWNSMTNTISGVIRQYQRSTLIAQSDFSLERSAFTAATPVTPASYTSSGGKYTVILPAKAQTNGLVAADFPQGDGIGLITITPAGNVSLVGTLADNTAISASAPLNSALKAPLFAQLYKLKGSFSALVALDNETQADSDLTAADAVWFRPFQNKVQHYPWGWEEGVKMDLVGAKYVAVANTTVIPGLVPASGAGNATLVFTGGLLDDVISNDLDISLKNGVTQIPAATSGPYVLTITAATGDIKGTFTHTDGTKPAFKGKVLQKGANAGARGFFLTVPPKVIDGLGESGSVDLFKK